MRRIISFILIFIILFTLVGCKNPFGSRIEINDMLFIEVVGIDKSSTNPDNVKITVAAKGKKGQGGGDEQGGPNQGTAAILVSEGRTIFEALRKLNSFADKTPFYSHTSNILIDEEIAKNDILKYMDFLFRDHEMRLNSNIFIVKGCTAEKFIRTGTTSQAFIGDRLKALLKNNDNLSVSAKVELIDLMKMFDDTKVSSYIPCVQLIENRDKTTGQRDIELSGLAIFKGTTLAGFLDSNTTRGLNWATNRVFSCPIIVYDREKNRVALDIIEAKGKIIPKILDDQISILIRIAMSSNISEYQGHANIFKMEYIDYLNEQQEKIIEREVLSALAFAKEHNADIFQFSNAIYNKYPIQWDSIKDGWFDTFPDIDVAVHVEGKINRTYDIRQSTRSMGDDQ
jgi:spore germination protein KC